VDTTTALEGQSQLLLELQAKDQVNATFVTGTSFEHTSFNIQPNESIINSGVFAGWDQDGDGFGPFGDVHLRQAIAMCMDRQAVVDTALYGQSVVIDTYLPPNHPLFAADANHWPYDTKAAAALLDEIGWKDTDKDPATPRVAQAVTGVPDNTLLEFNYETTNAPMRQQVSQILAQNLAECGIKVSLDYHPASEWFANEPDGRLFGRLYDLGEGAWITSSEPPCGLYLGSEMPTEVNGWGGLNFTGFNDPAFDTACLAAYQSLPGEEAYAANHLEAQRIFAEQLPAVPLFLRLKLAVTRPDMCNFVMDPTGGEMWNVENFDFGEGCNK
jgi:peptide/nickel transport system substrate-binding protein